MILHTLSHGQPMQPWRALSRPVSLSLSLLLAGCMGEGSLDVGSGDTVGAFQAVHELTQTHCNACHSENPTAVDIPPKHAHSDTRLALKEVQNNGLINVNKPELSRLYQKLRDEQHQCWTDCPTSASQMLSAIQAFVNGAAMDNTPANNALKLASVPVVFRAATGGGTDAAQTTTVVHYALTEGSGTQALDTSNFEKPLNLTVAGAQWASGGGLAFSGAQGEKASVFGFDVAKIHDNTVGSKGTGAYSVETWFIPGTVTEGTRGYLWNYGATSLDVNVALAQVGAGLVLTTKGDGASGLNDINLGVQVEAGTPYHVAVTHATGTGFRVFVNGQALGLAAQDPGVTRWNRLAQLVLGNSSSGGTPWTGTLKTFAFHRAQLPADVIASHYSAGQDRFAVNDAPVTLRFNITDLVNIPNTYIEMQGREYDAESYFFYKPTVSLGGAGSFRLKGLRIAINGDVQVSAQAYAKLDTQVTQNGQVLSELGTIMRKQDGPTADMIALAFEALGNQQNAWIDPEPTATVSPKAQASTELGLPMFDAIYYNLASALGVSPMNRTVRDLYDGLKTQLPTTSDAMSLNAGVQTAITKLSTQFCSEMIADNAARQALFGNVNLGNNANQAFAAGSRDVFYRPLYDRLVVGGEKQPTYEEVAAELDVLVDQMLGANVNSTSLLTGVCAAVAASAPTYIHD